MDTIAAVATASGTAGIAVIRISGPGAPEALKKCFTAASGREIQPGKLIYGHVTDENGGVMDEVMAVYMKAPHSYTREDVAEIQCHGGDLNARRILKRVLGTGVRLAGPGEFTRRAFENGRIDLSQAEAVMSLIGARSQAAARAAVRQLEGGVSRIVSSAADNILSMLSLIEAGNDFPEEIEEEASRDSILKIIEKTESNLSGCLNERRASMIQSGACAVLCGRPNTGKSSLMNAILESERAIVTEIPGTTRDTLSESLDIGGITVTLTDTAGQRSADDPVEKIGVEKAKRAQQQADLVLLVIDVSQPPCSEDMEMISSADDRYIAVLNKSDLPAVFDESLLHGLEIVRVSALTGEGIDVLRDKIGQRLAGSSCDEALLTSERQIGLCREAVSLLKHAQEGLAAGYPLDVASVDLQDSLEKLWSMTGKNVRECVIDQVFTMFCVGK